LSRLTVMIFRLIYTLLFLLVTMSQAGAATFSLTLVMSEKSGAYLEFFNALNKDLAGRDIAVSVADPGMPLPVSDLVVAVGIKAAASTLQSGKGPLLAVLVPKEGYTRLLAEHEIRLKAEGRMYSAIYLDQPVERQFAFIRALFPKIRSVGLLYSVPPPEIGLMRVQAKARSLELHEQAVAPGAALAVSLQDLLVSSDILLALPDAEIYNASTIRNILLATYRNRVPLVGFSSGYVKAGALAAIYSKPEQIADQAASVVLGFAEKHALPPAQHARDYELAVNEQVARSLGLNIRSESQLRAEIGKGHETLRN
jgi:putative tryptophan/tyrosine transport system substrate-binding protein